MLLPAAPTPKKQKPSQNISLSGGQGIYQNICSPNFGIHFIPDFSSKPKEKLVIKRTVTASACLLQLAYLVENRLTGFYFTSHG